MAVWQIQSKDGSVLRARTEGTKKQAEKWANDHLIPGSFKIVRDREFKWKNQPEPRKFVD